jgi:ferrochelatase
MTIRGAHSPEDLTFDRPRSYDALLVLSFGGPEGMDDVMPFLENVTRGRNIPRERLEEVAHHYRQFGGVSPLNQQNRELIARLRAELGKNGPDLPVYFGNRNWRPLVTDTVREMRDAGVRRALVFVTAGFSCYSGCRQYREDVIRAAETVGADAPEFDKIRVFYNHPRFIAANSQNLQATLEQIPVGRRDRCRVVFTAHSIPQAMARESAYEKQLGEASRLVAESCEVKRWDLVYQSRSGPPQVPWLDPDILAHLATLAQDSHRDVVIHPIGFISDHIEVLWDLDHAASQKAAELEINLMRVPTVGTHPEFVNLIRELILERMTPNPERRAIGRFGPNHDICPVDCCLIGARGRTPR